MNKFKQITQVFIFCSTIALFNCHFLKASQAITLKINEVRTIDSADGTVTIWDDVLDTYTPKSNNNYVTQFTIENRTSGATQTIFTDDFAAFIPTSVTATQVIQQVGTSNLEFSSAAQYLTNGTGGLSTSTAINVTTATPPAALEFDITNASLGNVNDTVLFFGDSANNQSNDSLTLKDSAGNVIAKLDITGSQDDAGAAQTSDWSKLGKQTIARFKLNGNKLDEKARDIAFLALTWADFGITEQATLDTVASLTIAIPDGVRSTKGRTDYAFFAANTSLIQSPDLTPTVAAALTPEPSQLLGLLLIGGFGAIKLKRR